MIGGSPPEDGDAAAGNGVLLPVLGGAPLFAPSKQAADVRHDRIILQELSSM